MARRTACWAPRLSAAIRVRARRIGAVINVEARGNQGPSYLFQTSAGDGRLIDLYARAVPHYAAIFALWRDLQDICPTIPT